MWNSGIFFLTCKQISQKWGIRTEADSAAEFCLPWCNTKCWNTAVVRHWFLWFLFSLPKGAKSIIQEFPEITILTTEVHPVAPTHFGQKYFGTDWRTWNKAMWLYDSTNEVFFYILLLFVAELVEGMFKKSFLAKGGNTWPRLLLVGYCLNTEPSAVTKHSESLQSRASSCCTRINCCTLCFNLFILP